jgi:hypothetical protein
LEKQRVKAWTGFDPGKGSISAFCEYSDEHFSYTKGTEFLDQMRDYELIKKDTFQWNSLVK